MVFLETMVNFISALISLNETYMFVFLLSSGKRTHSLNINFHLGLNEVLKTLFIVIDKLHTKLFS